MKKQTIIMLVGNIGSGKTKLSQEIQKDGYVVLSKDSLRYSIGAGNYIFNLKYEPIIWQTEQVMFECFLDLGCSIVLDGTNMSRRTREKYLDIIKESKKHPVVICLILPNYSKKQALDNRMKNPHGPLNRRLWGFVYNRFKLSYQVPSLNEGFDIIDYV